jgi:hypothetical protein
LKKKRIEKEKEQHAGLFIIKTHKHPFSFAGIKHNLKRGGAMVGQVSIAFCICGQSSHQGFFWKNSSGT